MTDRYLSEKLGSGGEGAVFAVRDAAELLASRRVVAGRLLGHGPFVYKRYHSPSEDDCKRVNLLVTWLATLDWKTQNFVMAHTTWPLVLSTNGLGHGGQMSPGGGELDTGVIMKRLDDSYFVDVGAIGGGSIRKFRGAEFLLWDKEQAAARNVSFPGMQSRLELLSEVASVLAVLHRSGMAYGDISGSNIIADESWSSPIIVDCDSIGRANLNTPGWETPEGGSTLQTDRYKFAALVMRVIGCAPSLPLLVEAAKKGQVGLSESLTTCVLAGLQQDPSRRPTIAEFHERLHAEANRADPAALPPRGVQASSVRRANAQRPQTRPTPPTNANPRRPPRPPGPTVGPPPPFNSPNPSSTTVVPGQIPYASRRANRSAQLAFKFAAIGLCLAFLLWPVAGYFGLRALGEVHASGGTERGWTRAIVGVACGTVWLVGVVASLTGALVGGQ